MAIIESIRVYVTERCNANCPNCFNSKSRSNREMKLEDFTRLCDYLKKNGIRNLKLMGGEPTIHKEFYKFVEIAQDRFKSISIFTNGIENDFKNLKLRKDDSVVYNFRFYKYLDENKLFLKSGGNRSLEVQVYKDMDEKQVSEKIIELVSIKKSNISVNLTLDCQSNIFAEKDIVIPKLLFIEEKLKQAKIDFSYDHKMPFCYLYKTGLHPRNLGECEVESAGVIDSSLNLRFCLQNTEPLLNLIQKEQFVPWQIVMNHLYKKYYELRLKSLNKICINCIFFNNGCNGGCWIPQDYIQKEEILNKTAFPII